MFGTTCLFQKHSLSLLHGMDDWYPQYWLHWQPPSPSRTPVVGFLVPFPVLWVYSFILFCQYTHTFYKQSSIFLTILRQYSNFENYLFVFINISSLVQSRQLLYCFTIVFSARCKPSFDWYILVHNCQFTTNNNQGKSKCLSFSLFGDEGLINT